MALHVAQASIGVALIGAGDWGEKHLQCLALHPAARVQWVCDLDPARAQAMAERYGAARHGTDWTEAVADPEVEAVSVNTPEDAHFAVAAAALDAGKPVLVEKPLTVRVDEAEKLLSMEQTSRGFIFPAHLSRFLPSFATARHELAAGVHGRPVSLHARRNVPRERLRWHGRTHPAFMALSHDIDLILWFVGRPVQRAYAVERRTRPDLTHPDVFWGLLEFAGGAVAALETLWVLPTANRYVDVALEVAAEEGVIHLHMPHQGLRVQSPEGDVYPDTEVLPAGDLRQGALYREVDEFLARVAAGAPSRVITTAEAVEGVRVADALIRSARQGRPIDLAEPAGPTEEASRT